MATVVQHWLLAIDRDCTAGGLSFESPSMLTICTSHVDGCHNYMTLFPIIHVHVEYGCVCVCERETKVKEALTFTTPAVYKAPESIYSS